jgi:alkaline phosphatase D
MTTTRRGLLLSGCAMALACADEGRGARKEEGGDSGLGGEDITPSSTPATTPTSSPTTTGPTTSATTSASTTPTGSTSTTTTSTTPFTEPSTPWVPPGVLDLDAFAWGVQTGDALPSGVVGSVRTTEPEVELLLVQGILEDWVEVSRISGLVPDNKVVGFELTDLEPDTTYALAFLTSDGRRSGVGRFRTALAAGSTRLIRFGATSCLGGNSPWPNLSQAAAQRLDFFCLLGDTIYADADWGEADFEGEWEVALSTDGLRDVTGSTSVLATWDDHEVDNNWAWDDDEMPEKALDALTAFQRALPMRRGPGGLGLWRRTTWGEAIDVFVLDCRGERIAGRYISPDQMDWLIEGVQSSTATFKLILNSVPITDMGSVYGPFSQDDRWQGYPAERTELLDALSGIPGVLFVAGDFHWGALCRVDPPGEPFDGIWEVFAGPSGSAINPLALFVEPDPQYELVIARYNYTLFEADPVGRTLRVAFIDDDGGVIAERTLVA